MNKVEKQQNVDASDLRKVILNEAEQFREGFEAAAETEVPVKKLRKVTVSGIGGSALPANVLRIYLNSLFGENNFKHKIDIFQNRFYTLPPEAYDNCLNIVCSHSGNTEETIASFEEILANNLPAVTVSAGGTIEEMSHRNGVPHVKLPIPFKNFQPRMATGHFVAAMVSILTKAEMIPDCQREILRTADKLRENIPAMEEIGRELAQKLIGTTPVIYSSARFKSLAMIWKIKFNENSKVPSFWNFFPELNHNEFVGFTNPQGKFHVVMLRDRFDHPRNLKRFEVTRDFLQERGIEVSILDIPEGEIFYRIFAALTLGDWVSYYLALAYGQDPTPVDMVEDFKKALK